MSHQSAAALSARRASVSSAQDASARSHADAARPTRSRAPSSSRSRTPAPPPPSGSLAERLGCRPSRTRPTCSPTPRSRRSSSPPRPRRTPTWSCGRRRRQGGLLREAGGPDPGRGRPGHRRHRRRRGWPCRWASTAASPPTSPPATGWSRDGGVGTPQLMRSLTRDPGPGRPRRRTAVDDLPPDPDPRLRHAAVAEPGRGAGHRLRHRRRAGRPGVQGRGPARHRRRRGHLRQRGHRRRGGQLLRRLRLRRPRRGIRVRGHGHHGRRRPRPRCRTPRSTGRHVDTVRGDVELLRDSYIGEFVEFADAVREGRAPAVTGQDARRALVARARGHRVGRDRRVRCAVDGGATSGERRRRLHAGRLRRDGLPRPPDRGAGRR